MTYWHRCKCKPLEESRKGWHRQSRQAPGLQSLRQLIQRKQLRARRSKRETSYCNAAEVQPAAFWGKLTRSVPVRMPITAHSSGAHNSMSGHGPPAMRQRHKRTSSSSRTQPRFPKPFPQPPPAPAKPPPPLSRCSPRSTHTATALGRSPALKRKCCRFVTG